MRKLVTAMMVAAALSAAQPMPKAEAQIPSGPAIVVMLNMALWAAIIYGTVKWVNHCSFGDSSNGYWDFAGYDGRGRYWTDYTQACITAQAWVAISLHAVPDGVVAVQPDPDLGWDFLPADPCCGVMPFYDSKLADCASAALGDAPYTSGAYCVSHYAASPPPGATVTNWDRSSTGNGHGWYCDAGGQC